MNKFKLTKEQMVAVKKLKQDPAFTAVVDALSQHLGSLDKHLRASVDPNQMLKVSGMAKQVEDILDSVKSV